MPMYQVVSGSRYPFSRQNPPVLRTDHILIPKKREAIGSEHHHDSNVLLSRSFSTMTGLSRHLQGM